MNALDWFSQKQSDINKKTCLRFFNADHVPDDAINNNNSEYDEN